MDDRLVLLFMLDNAALRARKADDSKRVGKSKEKGYDFFFYFFSGFFGSTVHSQRKRSCAPPLSQVLVVCRPFAFMIFISTHPGNMKRIYISKQRRKRGDHSYSFFMGTCYRLLWRCPMLSFLYFHAQGAGTKHHKKKKRANNGRPGGRRSKVGWRRRRSLIRYPCLSFVCGHNREKKYKCMWVE